MEHLGGSPHQGEDPPAQAWGTSLHGRSKPRACLGTHWSEGPPPSIMATTLPRLTTMGACSALVRCKERSLRGYIQWSS